VAALADTQGYSVSVDPINARALIFGGVRGGVATSRLISLDLGTGEVLVRSDGATERLDRREEAWTCH